MQEVAQSPEDSHTQALQAFLDLPSKFPLSAAIHQGIRTLLTMRREGVQLSPHMKFRLRWNPASEAASESQTLNFGWETRFVLVSAVNHKA